MNDAPTVPLRIDDDLDDDARRLFDVYLRDHLVGAVGSTALAKRVAGSEEDPSFAPAFDALAYQFAQDEDRVNTLAEALGVRTPTRLLHGMAWLGTRVGKLKLNGRLVHRSPLSRVMEIEALQAAVSAKRSLWRSLRVLSQSGRVPRLEGLALPELLARAEAQAEWLADLHDRAAGVAFARVE